MPPPTCALCSCPLFSDGPYCASCARIPEVSAEAAPLPGPARLELLRASGILVEHDDAWRVKGGECVLDVDLHLVKPLKVEEGHLIIRDAALTLEAEAMIYSHSQLTIERASVTAEGKASKRPLIEVDRGDLVVSHATITGHGRPGLRVESDGTARIFVADSTFQRCHTPQRVDHAGGGAIHVFFNVNHLLAPLNEALGLPTERFGCQITRCHFLECTAREFGGAVGVHLLSMDEVTDDQALMKLIRITDCRFERCRAEDGGGLYVSCQNMYRELAIWKQGYNFSRIRESMKRALPDVMYRALYPLISEQPAPTIRCGGNRFLQCHPNDTNLSPFLALRG
jgi:hypothetical protein